MLLSLAGSGGRALGGIINKFKKLKGSGYETYSKLFDTCVTSVLHYSSGIWGAQASVAIDQVQQRARRYFMGVHRYAPIAALHGEMGWYPLYIQRYVSIFRYWNRLVGMQNDRLTRIAFNTDFEKCNKN